MFACLDERLRIIINSKTPARQGELAWSGPAWDGKDSDSAKLVDPNGECVAFIQVTPDMLQGAEKDGNCIFM